jgi:hypothetical protein
MVFNRNRELSSFRVQRSKSPVVSFGNSERPDKIIIWLAEFIHFSSRTVAIPFVPGVQYSK